MSDYNLILYKGKMVYDHQWGAHLRMEWCPLSRRYFYNWGGNSALYRGRIVEEHTLRKLRDKSRQEALGDE